MEETNQATAENNAVVLGHCPKCDGKIVETRLAFSCRNWRENNCKFAIWKSIAGREIDELLAVRLLEKGITPKLGGFVSKNGNEFEAALKLEDGKVKFVFDGQDQ